MLTLLCSLHCAGFFKVEGTFIAVEHFYGNPGYFGDERAVEN